MECDMIYNKTIRIYGQYKYNPVQIQPNLACGTHKHVGSAVCMRQCLDVQRGCPRKGVQCSDSNGKEPSVFCGYR